MEFVSLDHLHRSIVQRFDGIGKILPRISTVDKEIHDRRKLVSMTGNHVDSSLPVCNIGTGDMDGVGQPQNIHNDVQLDARYLLACIISLFLCGISILYALCIHYAEGCLVISLVLLAGISHQFFLILPPTGFAPCHRDMTICENGSKPTAILENPLGASATGCRLSGHTERRRKHHISRRFLVLSVFLPVPNRNV